MKNLFAHLIAFGLATSCFAAQVGKPAPDFSLPGTDGKTWKLSDQKGKVVVLEWFNEGCPFVQKHYTSGNVQKLQKETTSQGVVWMTILSSAPGKQGYVTVSQLGKDLARLKASSTVGLVDPTGVAGKAFEAKTTPHLFVINSSGVLVYEGAIDDNSSADPKTVSGAKNYVRLAVDSVLKGEAVKEATTKPYGCSVKYP
ncbi:MAG: thioredoxin family protein [Proteobacteria bacterium]|nr:thioredoxin family protein [Pseudomonadota bacterium]